MLFSRIQALIPILLGSVLPMLAQGPTEMRADIRGQNFGDRGKCTIEVNVDDVAEVEVSGDMYRVRTLAGQLAYARRFVCSSPMPRSMRDFQLKGIDGRGRIYLARDPRQNRGVAVIRIEDPKGGREGYTFDLLWSGGDYGRPGWSDGRPGGGGGYPGGGYPGGGGNWGNNGNVFVITCSSDDGRRRYCPVNTSRGVRLLRQYTDACRGRDAWGFDNRGVWVDRGCRADFEIRR